MAAMAAMVAMALRLRSVRCPEARFRRVLDAEFRPAIPLGGMSYTRAGGITLLWLLLGVARTGVARGDTPRVTLHAYEEGGGPATANAVEGAVGEVLAG